MPKYPDSDCFQPMNGESNNGRIVCLHTVSGQISCYRDLAACLEGKLQVVGVRAPGLRGDRDPLLSISEMAEYYLGQLTNNMEHSPVAFLGWSTGGIIAWEMGRQAAAAGLVPPPVFLLDSQLFTAQLAGPEREAWVERGLWNVFSAVVLGFEEAERRDPQHPFWRLNPDDRLPAVIQRVSIESVSRFWKTQSEKEVERYFSFFKTQWLACRTGYWPGSYLGKAFFVSPDQPLYKGAWREWMPYAEGAYELLVSPGAHVSMLMKPNVRHLSSTISAAFLKTSLIRSELCSS